MLEHLELAEGFLNTKVHLYRSIEQTCPIRCTAVLRIWNCTPHGVKIRGCRYEQRQVASVSLMIWYI